MRKGKGESQGTDLSKVDIFKQLLRNKVNKANIVRSKTKEIGKNHGIQPSRMEGFR